VTVSVAEGFWVVPTAVALSTTVPVPGEPTPNETATVVELPGPNVGTVAGTGAPTVVTAPVGDAARVQPEMDLVQLFFTRKPAEEPVFGDRLIELGVAVRVGWQRFGPTL
jgi:hypothetical protein